MRLLVAITGATGFLGRYIVGAVAARGWRVRVLARQPVDHPQFAGLTLDAVPGDLSNPEALRALVDGADVIIHAAGLIKASSSAAFEAVNVTGTANLAEAIEKSGGSPRVLLVSSMAAREPALSSYARTKRAAEQLLTAKLNRRGKLIIVRPSVIYGPWDRETLSIFRAIAWRIFPRPRVHSRVAVIHAADAAAAIAALCEQGPPEALFELTDERFEGYSWDEIVSAAETVMGTRALVIRLPGPAVKAAAAVSLAVGKLRRRTPLFTPGKAREFLHADWGSNLESQPPRSLWRPQIGLAQGFRDTVNWYRDRRWLTDRRAACEVSN
jgi:nucleoside-diphosphate-sugar epimerase